VSAEEADRLRAQGHQPGDPEWEQTGICQSVTWPRSKSTILGYREDKTKLPGSYMTGRFVEVESPRKFTQLSFVNAADLRKTANKKQLVSLLNDMPQSLVEKDSHFVVSPKHSATILFDIESVEEWFLALEDQVHITDFYILTTSKRDFERAKTSVTQLLGPLLIKEEEKRPLADGFEANCVYFRMEFLDKDQVALNRALRELLPLLWLKAGGYGTLPKLGNKALPKWLAPEANNFAILLVETAFGALLSALKARPDITCVYVVTDANESFKDMQAELFDTLETEERPLEVVQLYRDYLINFMINKAADSEAELIATDVGAGI
jgi:adenine-specific DNA-methyltransferase